MDYFNKKIDEVEKELDTSLENGLKKDGIDKKREKYGFNELESMLVLKDILYHEWKDKK